MVKVQKALKESLGVMIGGGLGTLTRFFINYKAEAKPFPSLPTTTLFINVSGSLFLGVLFGLFEKKISNFYKALIFIGFFGSYTTFSELSFDTNTFILHRYFGIALLNIGLSLLGGLISFGFGYAISKIILKNKKS